MQPYNQHQDISGEDATDLNKKACRSTPAGSLFVVEDRATIRL